MTKNQTLIEDAITLGGNMLGNILGARHEFKAQGMQRMESITRRLDLVSRSEFDAAFGMLAKARSMQEELHDRLTVIESKMGLSGKSKTKQTSTQSLRNVKKSNRVKKRA